jgi:hypothetical protein
MTPALISFLCIGLIVGLAAGFLLCRWLMDDGNGMRAIAIARRRDTDRRGCDIANDGAISLGTLARSAGFYIDSALYDLEHPGKPYPFSMFEGWPRREMGLFIPRDARRDLATAGALISAQLDALLPHQPNEAEHA